MKGIGAVSNLPSKESPVTTAANLSALIQAQPWQPPSTTQPRDTPHLLPPYSHTDTDNLLLQAQPISSPTLLERSAPLSKYESRSVTVKPASEYQAHSSQVTTANGANSSFFHSPAHGHSSELRLDHGYHPSQDQKPYLSPSFPSPLQASSAVPHTSHPRDYHPSNSDGYHDTYKTYPQAITSASQDMSSPNYDQDGQVNPMASDSLGSLRFGRLPCERDLQIATTQACSIYRTFHAPGAGDDTRKDAIRELDIDNVPKSVDLHNAVGIRTYFPDALTAEAYRGACRPNSNPQDDTIPSTTASQQAHVRLLVLAFNSVAHATDNMTMKQPFIDKRHDQKLVECLCWKILKAIVSRAEYSNPLMTSYDANKARDSIGIKNFADRFDAVVSSMISCKTICKHMYDAPYLNIVVDDPLKAKARVDSNRALNAVKAKQMAEGKKVQELKSEEDGTPPPAAKRKRVARVQSVPASNAQSPFRRTQPMPGTPFRPNLYPTLQAEQIHMDPDSSPSHPGSSPYPSSPDDANVSHAHLSLQRTIGKQEFSRPPGSMRFATSTPLGMLQDASGRTIFPYGRQGMGPSPPGATVPMQPDVSWNAVSQALL